MRAGEVGNTSVILEGRGVSLVIELKEHRLRKWAHRVANLFDGLAYVKEGTKVFSEPGGAEGLADVPAGMDDAVIESAEECPGECIFIEIE